MLNAREARQITNFRSYDLLSNRILKAASEGHDHLIIADGLKILQDSVFEELKENGYYLTQGPGSDVIIKLVRGELKYDNCKRSKRNVR